MPEKSDEPPKFNVLEALNKEIGKKEKKLSTGEEVHNAARTSAQSTPPRGAGAGTQGTKDGPQKAQEEIVRLIGPRSYLEDDLLSN